MKYAQADNKKLGLSPRSLAFGEGLKWTAGQRLVNSTASTASTADH